MGIEDTVYALSNINAILGSTQGYFNDKKTGAPTGYAMSNFGYNVLNGAMRNAASRDIQQTTGSYLGYAVNNAAGYGSPQANMFGMQGTMGALMMSALFNPRQGCCNAPFMYGGMGIYSPFSPMGFWC